MNVLCLEPVVLCMRIVLLVNHFHCLYPPSAETTSKDLYREALALPWDCHLDDELLKSLIKRARTFEDDIRYAIDPALHSYGQLRNAFCLCCSVAYS